MIDRFNFRFGVTISHYDENDEDIETTIICETEAIFDDGTVGICKETLENVITSLHLSKERERTLWNALYEYERIEDWFVLDPDFIEQCTGLKDKNGKLIYEGDILLVKALDWKKKERWEAERVKTYWSVEYKSYWNQCGFMVFGKNRRFHKPLTRTTIFNSEAVIIGNIHENQELLKEEQ